jgi:hypothetical protein
MAAMRHMQYGEAMKQYSNKQIIFEYQLEIILVTCFREWRLAPNVPSPV